MGTFKVNDRIRLLFDLQADNPGESGIPAVGELGYINEVHGKHGTLACIFDSVQNGDEWILEPSDVELIEGDESEPQPAHAAGGDGSPAKGEGNVSEIKERFAIGTMLQCKFPGESTNTAIVKEDDGTKYHTMFMSFFGAVAFYHDCTHEQLLEWQETGHITESAASEPDTAADGVPCDVVNDHGEKQRGVWLMDGKDAKLFIDAQIVGRQAAEIERLQADIVTLTARNRALEISNDNLKMKCEADQTSMRLLQDDLETERGKRERADAAQKKAEAQRRFVEDRQNIYQAQYKLERENSMLLGQTLMRAAPDAWKAIKDKLNQSNLELDKVMCEWERRIEAVSREKWSAESERDSLRAKVDALTGERDAAERAAEINYAEWQKALGVVNLDDDDE